MHSQTISWSAAVLMLSTQVEAFWRMPCSRSGHVRIDPLVNPGEVSYHSHAIHGSSAFSASVTYEELRAAHCTSCQVAQDKSVYWTPPPYFKNSATGEYTLVNQVGGMLAYYLLYPNAGNDTLSAFPEGFRMLAGRTLQRNFTLPVPDPDKSLWSELGQDSQADLAAKALGFNCMNYNNKTATEGSLYRHFMPDKAFIDQYCPDGIRFELMFPSCWDGVNAFTKDSAHVAYPDLVMTGTCPTTHPIRLPSLFYETIWDMGAFSGVDGEFVISNGDPTGYGYHGDFMMGWDPDFLQQAVDTCTNLSGEIADCPLFTIQDANVYNTCSVTVPDELVDEDVVGPMDALPGKVAVQYGPGLAIDGLTNDATNVTSGTSTSGYAAPTLSVLPGPTEVATASQTYAVGGVFQQVSIAGPTAVPTVPTMSQTTFSSVITSAPVNSSSIKPADIYSTQWTTISREAVEIFWVEETVTVTEIEPTTAMATATVTVAPRAVQGHQAHAAKHRRGHNHI